MRYPILLLLALCTLFACREDEFVVTTTTDMPDPVVFRETEVFGRVVDAEGRGVPDVSVFWLDGATLTDQLGVFRVRASTNQRVATLRLSHPDYFDVSRRLIIPPSNRITAFRQILQPQNRFPLVNVATAGGQLQFQDGLQLTFPPNALATSDGQPYGGDVFLAEHYLAPTEEDVQFRMPGNLLATDANDETRYLRSFGMAAVELFAADGSPLQLLQPVGISLPVPDALLADAPSEIPLWYFDETEALWIEEGSATLQGDRYVGSVAHFTWWNCDVPGPWVFLEIQFAPPAQAAGLWARLTQSFTGISTVANIDPTGYAAGFVPGGETFALAVLPPYGLACQFTPNDVLIGPFDEDTFLDDQPVNFSAPSVVDTLTAKGLDCAGAAITNGYAVVTYSTNTAPQNFSFEEIHPLDSLGCLRITDMGCNAGLSTTVQLVDVNAGLESDPVTVDWVGTLHLGSLPACNTTVPDLTQFELGGDTVRFFQTTASLYDDPATNSSLVTITTYDLQVDGLVKYTIELRKWALSAFQWQITATAEPSGSNPPGTYFFDGSGIQNADVTVSDINAPPGSQVAIQITNVIITDPTLTFSDPTTLLIEATVVD